MGQLIFILGGARSGKSLFAQRVAKKAEEERGGKVIYLATGSAGDEEMQERIEKHRRSRSSNWKTVEAPLDVSAGIAKEGKESSAVIVDCITLLITNFFLSDAGDTEGRIFTEIENIIKSARNVEADVIIVSNEVGMGIVPESQMGRRFRDIAGRAHQCLAEAADEVYLMTAGLPQRLK